MMAGRRAQHVVNGNMIVLLVSLAIGFAEPAHAQSRAEGRRLFEQGRPDEARRALEDARRTDPRDAETVFLLGRLANLRNDDDVAVQHLEAAVRLDSANADYRFWLGKVVADAAMRGSMIKMPFLVRRIRQEWVNAVRLDPGHIGARYGLLELYATAPGALGGSVEKARMEAAAIAPRQPMRGAMARAVLAAHDKDIPQELAAFREAITLAPDSLDPYVGLVDALLREERSEEVVPAIEPFLQRHPDNAWGHYHLGRVAASVGEPLARGDSALLRFIASPPYDAGVSTRALAHYWRGKIAERRGDTQAARSLYQAALRINPKSKLSRRALEALR